MGLKKMVHWLIFLIIALALPGCGGDLPFEYRYLSASVVQINYLDKVYELDRFGDKIDAPFTYEFESDGDLDIVIAGKAYDIDSPYDIDKPKKKSVSKKTVSKKKKSTRKRKK